MATKTVRDIMSPDLVYVTEDVRTSIALPQILRFGITAVPVLDEHHRPIGVISLRDLVGGADINAAMTAPAQTIAEDASIDAAARTLAAGNVHHLVVVGNGGLAVGMLSSLDLLRAILNLPVAHPEALHEPKRSSRHVHGG